MAEQDKPKDFRISEMLKSEGLLIALAPAIAYFCTYLYDRAYLARFGVSESFADPALKDVLRVLATLVFGFIVIAQYLYLVRDVPPDERPEAFWKWYTKKHLWQLVLLILIIAFYRGEWRSVWLPMLFLVPEPAINLYLRFKMRRRFSGESFVRTMKEAVNPPNLRQAIALWAWLLVIPFQLLGDLVAYNQRGFYVPSMNTNLLVLKITGDWAVCIERDAKTHSITTNTVMLNLADAEQMTFSRVVFATPLFSPPH